MILEVEIQASDFLAFVRMLRQRNPGRSRILSTLWMLVAASVVVRMGIADALDMPFEFGCDTLVSLFLYLLAGAGLALTWASVPPPLADGSILGPQYVVITGTRVEMQGGGVATVAQWSGIRQLIETTDHYFLMTDGSAGFLLPRRHFDTPEQDAEFRRAVEEWSGQSWQPG